MRETNEFRPCPADSRIAAGPPADCPGTEPVVPPIRRKLSLTRELVARLPSRTDERGPVIMEELPSHLLEDVAADLLARLEPQKEIWVFAAGSLIWNPRMDVAERRVAEIAGWRRAFCLEDRRYRGSPSRPALMMSLDRGGSCRGVVQRMQVVSDRVAPLVDLLGREPPVPPEIVEVQTDRGSVNALLFAACPRMPIYRPEPPVEELADILASSVGHVGTMAEYLLNTVTELEKVGLHDRHLWRLQEMVAAQLAQS